MVRCFGREVIFIEKEKFCKIDNVFFIFVIVEFFLVVYYGIIWYVLKMLE